MSLNPASVLQASKPPSSLNSAAWLVLLAAFLGWMFDGLEQGIFPLIARPALRQMMGDAADSSIGPWMGYITAAFLVGAAAGGLVFGWLGDRIGRVAQHGAQRLMLLRIHRPGRLRPTSVASAGFTLFSGTGHGRGMVAGRRPCHGMLARPSPTVAGRIDRIVRQLWLYPHWPAGNGFQSDAGFLAMGNACRRLTRDPHLFHSTLRP